MLKSIVIFLFVVGVVACKNGETPANKTPEPTYTSNKGFSKDSAARLAELSFIDGCVENSKLTLGETKAFGFCKCMYGQIQTKYPDMDSAAISRMDTATINKLAENCR